MIAISRAFLCSFFIASACSDEMHSIVDEFYLEAHRRECYPKRMPIELAPLPEPAVGYCIPYLTMIIDSKAFRDFEYHQKREVVFHELGHCVLYREHTDDQNSLMTPKMHTEVALSANFGKMVDELFKDCGNEEGNQ